MVYRFVIPLAVVAILSLLVLVLIYWRHRKDEDLRREERILAEERWDGICRFDNPETGAKCQRQEFHLENHYREVNGKLVQWL